MTDKNITTLFRGCAFLIDMMICTSVAMAVARLLPGIQILKATSGIIGVGALLLFLRDIFGKSIGKYLLGLNIVSIKDNQKANLSQRLVKNITVPLSIIEIPFVVLSKDNKKIGDMLAKTKIVIDENSYALTIFNKFIKQ